MTSETKEQARAYFDKPSPKAFAFSPQTGNNRHAWGTTSVVEAERDAEGQITGWLFRGGGWGHGVGMCQTGAIGRAEAGFTAIVESAPDLTRLSAERVKEELEKTLEQVARPSVALARPEHRTGGSAQPVALPRWVRPGAGAAREIPVHDPSHAPPGPTDPRRAGPARRASRGDVCTVEEQWRPCAEQR